MDSSHNYDASPTALGATGTLDWADMSGSAHFVQFYNDKQRIIDAVAGYLVHGLRFGEACIIAVTDDHKRLIEKRMRSMYPDVDAAIAAGRFIALDARETLDKFMVRDDPQADLFEEVIGGVIRKAGQGAKGVRVFGEMVAVLTAEGNAAGALKLEHLWNGLAEKLSFRLFCAYPDEVLSSPDVSPFSSGICSSHSHVVGQLLPAIA